MTLGNTWPDHPSLAEAGTSWLVVVFTPLTIDVVVFLFITESMPLYFLHSDTLSDIRVFEFSLSGYSCH